jgi:polyisoprenyl-phosphate glycosyltransferase
LTDSSPLGANIKRLVEISVVVPIYSGARYLASLVDEIEKVRQQWAAREAPFRLAELILIDDAAIDQSPEIADLLSAKHDWIAVIHLARNFGQHAATVAGILHTSGDWVVTLDEDFQHPPGRIEDLLKTAVRGGSDIVYASPEYTVHGPVRDIASRLSKWLTETITGQQITSFNSFRLIRGTVARAAASICGHETYFDISLSWFSQRVSTVTMNLRDERFIKSGQSGYSIVKLLSHARKMLMSSGPRIMRAASLLGVAIIVLSAFGGSTLVVNELYSPSSTFVRGWSSLIVFMVFLTGVIIALLGIVLEYLALLVLDVHGKPIFFIVDRQLDLRVAQYFKEIDP